MPQMSPMNWILLMIMFSMIFFFFLMINYFSFNPKMPSFLKSNFKTKKMNWKW
uniref:ATP synthase complex subunit 8 n=1 Tax=Paratrichobius longicrus TaxID=402416 RepID=A0A5B9RU68_9MUSC|nr:ATP synthase F0 subunit 8 [Paratrichobius longicrus]QEG77647.1 ATP synthase F0 subunit 8 [Paratrichobius longicrus]